jgi:hypothetical protein
VDIVAMEDRLTELATDYAVGAIDRVVYHAAREAVSASIAAADLAPVVLPDLDDLADGWDDLPVPGRQLVLSAFIEKLVIQPAVRGRNTFDPTRIAVTWAV